MKRNSLLVVMAMLSLVLLSLHVTDDTVRGISPAGPESTVAIVVLGLLAYATLALANRMAGLVCTFLAGAFALAMPVLHMRGARINIIATGPGGFFFIWTLWALGAVGVVTMILAAREMWSRRKRPPTA